MHSQGLSEGDCAPADIEQNIEDAAQRSDDDEMEAALSTIDKKEVSAISRALDRLEEGDYGMCVSCGRAIPFERLEAEPQALRCLSCDDDQALASNN